MAAFRSSLVPEPEALASARDALAGRFSFLGRREDFGEDVDWFRSDLDVGTRLWKTLLHEQPYAVDLARAARSTGEARYGERLFALARSWRSAAPIGCRDFALDAWNGRAVATRLVHWAVAGALLPDPDPAERDWLGREIGLHGLFLRDNLELDLQGNHLLRDALGLVFAQELCGAAPDALDWLERVLAEQILPDGAHYERAPYYHLLCTADLVEARLLLGDASPAWLRETLSAMTGFLESIALGDGEIPLLGDGWLGELPTPAVLDAARALEAPCPPRRSERRSGIVALAAGEWRVVVRAGAHAPDEQMGHVHADLLSLDASFGTARVVSDTGTLSYDPGPERQRMRGTAAHNTLRIDGQEQIEAWGSFRVGRRGRARSLCRGHSGTWQWLSASHDAYEWLPGRPVHHRLVAVGPPGLVILDALLGSASHLIESHMHEVPNPGDVRIVPLRGLAEVEPAPLYERAGQTREMRRHRLCAEGALPWFGGWWIASAARPEDVEGLLRSGEQLELRLSRPQLRLSWKPGWTDTAEAVSFCSASEGSAT